MKEEVVVAGFDAGQTHTRCRLSLWDGEKFSLISEGEGTGVCHLNTSNGEKLFQEAIQLSFNQAIANSGSNLKKVKVVAAAIGASGVEQGTELQARAQQLLAQSLRLPQSACLATGDERIALHGVFPDQAGILLISGTGMICIGRNLSGAEHRCGGWGWLLDGYGSAFDLGQQALQMSLRMADGRCQDRAIRQQLWSSLNCSTAAEIKALAVHPNFGSAGFAKLAPVVDAAAIAGDDGAKTILAQSANALVEAVIGVAKALDLNTPNICACGGAYEHLDGFRHQIIETMQLQLPGAQWIKAHKDACDGALSLALKQINQPKN